MVGILVGNLVVVGLVQCFDTGLFKRIVLEVPSTELQNRGIIKV